tara:strand:- start:377 stop:679 length:303 start_codon:yes stop_codon:yes gene_type:complete
LIDKLEKRNLKSSVNDFDSALNFTSKVKRISKKFRINNCLTESLTSYLFLKEESSKIGLCIGVKKKENKLLSHSWLEFQDKPLVRDSDEIKGFYIIKKIS